MMKRVFVLITVLTVVVAACSCAKMDFYDLLSIITYEFECEFDIEFENDRDVDEFERALTTIGAVIVEKTQTTDDSALHYRLTAPWPIKESISLLPSYNHTELIYGDDVTISPSQISRCTLIDDYCAFIEADEDIFATVESNFYSLYLKCGDSLSYNPLAIFNKKELRIELSLIDDNDRPIVYSLVYSLNEIDFDGEVNIYDISERKTKQAFFGMDF